MTAALRVDTLDTLGRELLEELDRVDRTDEDLLDWILGNFRGRLRATVAAADQRRARRQEYEAALNLRVARMLRPGTLQTWRYWYEGPRGWRYGWTTVRDEAGKFYALEWKPIGKGARSSSAKRRQLVRKVGFRKRGMAKARSRQWLKTKEGSA